MIPQWTISPHKICSLRLQASNSNALILHPATFHQSRRCLAITRISPCQWSRARKYCSPGGCIGAGAAFKGLRIELCVVRQQMSSLSQPANDTFPCLTLDLSARSIQLRNASIFKSGITDAVSTNLTSATTAPAPLSLPLSLIQGRVPVSTTSHFRDT